MTADPYTWGTWPPSPIEREVRAERDAAVEHVAAVIALIVIAEGKDGRVPACALRKALDLPKRARP